MTTPAIAGSPDPSGESNLAIEAVLLGLGVVLMAATFAPSLFADALARYDSVRALIRGEVPAFKFSLIQPLLTVPLVLAGRAMYFGSRTVVTHFNMMAFIVFSVPIWLQLSRLFGARVATRTLLLLLSASMLPHHLLQYFGEVFSALAIVTGFLYARDRPVWAVVLLALGVGNTPALVVPVAVAALLLFRQAPAALVGAALAGLLIAIETYVRFGSLWASPYLAAAEKGYETVLPYSSRPGFSYPMFFGILSVLLSFGKGLVWFIPGLVTLCDRAVALRLRVWNARAGWALAAFCVSLVLVYSKWWAWYGGMFWGPRFFLILTIPASLALAVATMSPQTSTRSWVTLAILTLSFWVGIDGVVFDQQSMDVCWANNYELEFLCWYVPEFSALWRPFVTYDLRDLPGTIWHSQAGVFALWQCITWCYIVATMVRDRRRVTLLRA